MKQLRTRPEEILKMARIHGAKNVRVFGSVASDEARADSDIDVLVDMDPGRGVLDISELILDLEKILGRDVDVVVVRRHSPLADQIQRESVPL